MTKSTTDPNLLLRHTQRLKRRVQSLETRESQYFWYRMGAFFGGGVLVWLVFNLAGAQYGWLALLLAGAGFGALVYQHARLRRRLDCHRLWLEIYQQQAARQRLDWTAIPEPVWQPERPRGALATDLDLSGPKSLHQLLDVSVSRQGSQRLAEWLQQDNPDLDAIRRRQPIVQELAASRRFRLRLLLNYRQTQDDPLDGDRLVEWLQTPYPQQRLRWLLPVGIGLSLLNVSLFLLSSFAGLPNYWILTLVVYISFYLLNSSYLSEFLEAVVHMDTELGKVRSLLAFLEGYPLHQRPQLSRTLAPIRAAEPKPSQMVQRVKWITAAVGLRSNPVLGLLINAILPWDMLFASLAGRVRGTLAERLPAWLETLYTLEAQSGLANCADLHPEYSFPQLERDRQPVLEAQGLGHPLLPPDQKVRNDFSLQERGRVVIITGSNMAGKSTFLKTIGINLCLAYAGGAVDARCLQMVPFRLHTCMRISDSLTEGYSYFYAEVRCLKRLLERVQEEGPPLLYLVDEIFRGTNNRERLIGSRAYIQALTGSPGVGFLATHDLELAGLAEAYPQVMNYHFRESVVDRRLVFDYRLRPGPCPTTNALKIMQMEGLPVEEQFPVEEQNQAADG